MTKRTYSSKSILYVSTFIAIAPFITIAGRPLAIDDADPTDPGYAEAEVGLGYADDSGNKSWAFPLGWGLGIAPSLEAGIGFGGLYENSEEGIADTSIGAKWRFIDLCPLGARHAIAPSVKIPTADEDKGFGSGEYDAEITYINSRGLGESASVHLNVGYSWIGGTDKDVLHYGIAADYWCAKMVQWVGEIFFDHEMSSDASSVVQFNTGFRLTLNDKITFDLAGGSRIDGDAPDFFATAGLTWLYGFSNNTTKE